MTGDGLRSRAAGAGGARRGVRAFAQHGEQPLLRLIHVADERDDVVAHPRFLFLRTYLRASVPSWLPGHPAASDRG